MVWNAYEDQRDREEAQKQRERRAARRTEAKYLLARFGFLVLFAVALWVLNRGGWA